MNRVPEIFLSEVFGELRIIEENNKFYFCAVDVCKALGYTNITRELNIHCRQDGIKSGRVERTRSSVSSRKALTSTALSAPQSTAWTLASLRNALPTTTSTSVEIV